MTFAPKTVLALSAVLASLGMATASEVTIILEGIEDRGGTLYLSLQTEDQFMQAEAVAGLMDDAPSAGSATYTLTVPAGRYALAVWHDDNDNGLFDRQPNGEPLDGWAMINGSQLTGVPVFSTSSFEVSADGASISERLIYGR